MKVTYAKPAARTAPYVEAILAIEYGEVFSPFVLPVFANGMPTLLFSTAKGTIGEHTNHLTLFGQTIQPQQLVIKNSFKLIAYFLKPYALGVLFNIPANELTDFPIALNLLNGQSGLEERLLNAVTTDELMQLIDDYLFGRAAAIKQADARITHACKRISNTSNPEILTTVRQELYVTERTFQRMFEKHIGVSPNVFRRINQFNKAFQQLNGSNLPDLSFISHHHGYADQSHFIRAFKEFTNLTPTDYLRIRPKI
nr:AraC family transcriptional regulator [uncultured Mucilaginibacter sp.]